MTEKILQMVDAYWKFDNNQQPISSWNDKQYLLKALEELLQPDVSGLSEQLKAFLDEISNDKTYILNDYYKNKAKRLSKSL